MYILVIRLPSNAEQAVATSECVSGRREKVIKLDLCTTVLRAVARSCVGVLRTNANEITLELPVGLIHFSQVQFIRSARDVVRR